MELTKQEKKEQKKREKEEKKRLKAEGKTPMDPAKKKKIVKRSIIGAVAGVFVLFIVVSNISNGLYVSGDKRRYRADD